MLSKYLFAKEFMGVARLDPKHFTRQRTLTLPTVVSFLLSGVQAASTARTRSVLGQVLPVE